MFDTFVDTCMRKSFGFSGFRACFYLFLFCRKSTLSRARAGQRAGPSAGAHGREVRALREGLPRLRAAPRRDAVRISTPLQVSKSSQHICEFVAFVSPSVKNQAPSVPRRREGRAAGSGEWPRRCGADERMVLECLGRDLCAPEAERFSKCWQAIVAAGFYLCLL